MATHSCILAWETLWTEEPGGLQSVGVTKESATTQLLNTHTHSLCLLSPTPILLSSFSVVQFSRSVVSDSFKTPWTAARQAPLSITNFWSLHKLMSIESVMPSSHLILCRLLLLLPPTPPSIRVFSTESTLRIRWPKYWSFRFSISPSKEHPGLISFRMDWLDLLAVQGTLKSLLQHHSSKASILRCSAFFTVQLSRPYMTTPICISTNTSSTPVISCLQIIVTLYFLKKYKS